jgi:phosphopentomutase
MKIIILVIDSLGAGEMADVEMVRKQDHGANTLKHVTEFATDMNFPNLESLGAGYIVSSNNLRKSVRLIGSYGSSNLAHIGADTYQGHQEIIGSKPRPAIAKPFKEYIDIVRTELLKAGHTVTIPDPLHPFLVVDGLVTVADNIEADVKLNYNVTAPLDHISFEKELAIGTIVRNHVQVGRVIVLGGEGITIQGLLDAAEIVAPDIVGINCPKSGVYQKGYMVRHLGYGITPETQVTSILKKAGYSVTLIGKAADIIDCHGAVYQPEIDTEAVLQKLLNAMAAPEDGLIMANVQETDLAGHSENVRRYADKLKMVDCYLTSVFQTMGPRDVLFVTGDHGNDPMIGHAHHTREKAALFVYGKNLPVVSLGERSTLSDIGATAAEIFGVAPPEYGVSFWPMFRKIA